MKQYHDLLKHVLSKGVIKDQRATLLSNGTKPKIYSVFGAQNKYNLGKGFPLVTTKYMPWAAIAHELIWFISGSTNIKYLKDNKVKIWDEWADENGDLGPVYGKQWRSWEGPQGKIDQLRKLISDIQKVIDNPNASEGRRLIITAWNPADMPKSCIPTGCHTMAQFDITNNKLSCQLYQRSADLFLGVPFNIASYALLTHMIAAHVGLNVGSLVHTFGNAHIYENHLEQVKEQLTRKPFELPTLELAKPFDIFNCDITQIKLNNYKYHPSLKGEVAV